MSIRAPASGLVRVTVTSGSRRVDLVLPGAVPVAELAPELARSVGLLDAVTSYGGYRLVTREGRLLDVESGLSVQGVRHGAIITLAAGVDDEPPRIYDDVVEAMSDVVERDVEAWDVATGRRTALCAAVLLLLMGAASLVIQDGTQVAAVAVGVSVLLLLGAITLSRTGGEQETLAAVAVAGLGCVYVAAAGLLLVGDSPLTGTAIATAGGGSFVWGVVGALGLAHGRTMMMPPVVAGSVFLAAGLLANQSSIAPAVILTVALTLVTVGGSTFAWCALGTTGGLFDQVCPTTDPSHNSSHDLAPVDRVRVGADARLAREILVAMSASAGALLVLVAPFAASLGVAGTGLAVLASVVVLLHGRRHRAGTEVLVAITSGVLGLLSTALSVLCMHPGWRPVTAGAVVVTGTAVLALRTLPRGASACRGWLGDLVETVALVALPPTLVIATGVLSAIRR